MRKLTVAAVMFTLTMTSLWLTAPASAHNPFKDGPTTARQYAAGLNRAAAWDDVTCRYRTPHITCAGILKSEPKTDVWYRFTMTVHKTAARKGYAMACMTAIGVCRRYPVKFAV